MALDTILGMDAASGQSGGAAADQVVAALRREVLAGRLLPGERLGDQQLAKRFGVSRNTVRDALRLLVAEGLVVYRHNTGSRVRQLQPEDVRDIYIARRVIECSAVLLSTGASEWRLQAVELAAGATEDAAKRGAWREAGTASLVFHQALADLAESARLSAFFGTIAAQLRLVFAEIHDEAAFQSPWVSRDRQLADHVLSGRRDAAVEELRRYLDESEALVIDVVRFARRRDVRGRARGSR